MDEEIAHKTELLSMYKANLRKMELQAAQYGADVPVKIQNDLAYYQGRIAEISSFIKAVSVKDKKREEYETSILVKLYNELSYNSEVYSKIKLSIEALGKDLDVKEIDFVNSIIRLFSRSASPVFRNMEWSKGYRVAAEALEVEDFDWIAMIYCVIREAENTLSSILGSVNNPLGVLSNYDFFTRTLDLMSVYLDLALDTLKDTLSTRGIKTER